MFRAIDKFDGGLVNAVKNTFIRHLQFVSPEFSFLSLISYNVTPAEKKIIAQAIATTSNESLSPAPLKRVVPIDEHTQLKDLAIAIGVSTSQHRPALPYKRTDEQFQRLFQFAVNFHFTNTVAGHCIQLVTDYSGMITKDE